MKFIVDEKVFKKMPTVCFAIIEAQNIDNTKDIDAIKNMLDTNAKSCHDSLQGKSVKEIEEVLCFREAFKTLEINPNKFMCSIEALLSRIAKGNTMPHINAAVNLGNAVSLKYKLPIGAHDIDTSDGEIALRYSTTEDSFIPFGSDVAESIDTEEIVYVSKNQVRTRRWIWRQSEIGKINNTTKNIFFPIDGFSDKNKDNLLKAQEELASLLEKYFKAEIKTAFIDINNRECEL